MEPTDKNTTMDTRSSRWAERLTAFLVVATFFGAIYVTESNKDRTKRIAMTRFSESYQVLNPGKIGRPNCERVSGEKGKPGTFDCELHRNKSKKVLYGQCILTEDEATCTHYSPLCKENNDTCEKVMVKYSDPQPKKTREQLLNETYKVLP